MTTKEALEQAMKELSKMSMEELRAELEKNKDGRFSLALKEADQFLKSLGQQGQPVLD